jgi:DNA-binding MarR family transcriptional regulator
VEAVALDEGETCASVVALEHEVESCLAADPALASPPCTSPPCNGGNLDLTALEEDERLRMLAGLTARFSAAYLRWMRPRPGDVLAFSNVRVLELLQAGGPAIMRDIAGSLGTTARNMTAIIDSLEDAGLVRRVPHAHDRRATVIELTPDGRRESARARQQAISRATETFSNLSIEEQQAYADLLTRLAAGFCR